MIANNTAWFLLLGFSYIMRKSLSGVAIGRLFVETCPILHRCDFTGWGSRFLSSSFEGLVIIA